MSKKMTKIVVAALAFMMLAGTFSSIAMAF